MPAFSLDLSPSTLDILFIAGVFIIFILLVTVPHRSPSLPLPPGPRPLPVIGNALQFPTKDPHMKYHEWRKTYGDIVHLTAGRTHIVILNSAQVTFDLLEKRGKIYSDRPASVMVKMVGLDETWSLLPYGDTLRQFRKLGRHVMSVHAIKKYEIVQEEEARSFAKSVLDSPEDLVEHVERVTSSIMLRLLYGYSPSSELEALSTASRKLVANASKLLSASSRLLDLFPILKHIPAWFPFASFQQTAKDLRDIFHYVFHTPFNRVKLSLDKVEGAQSSSSSLCATLLQEIGGGQPFDSEGESVVRMFLGSTYPPGQETTASTLTTFFMLMATHPEVQAKVKAEIALVVGDYRLPALRDTRSLLYLRAVLKEVLRWHAVAPLGLPHCLLEEDEYNGVRIPKGSILFANIWEMMHDPEVYPEPFSFKPERFIGPGDTFRLGYSYNPFSYVFGFGRRSCPGMHLAEASLLAIMATVLATCSIECCRDSNGSEIYIEPEFTPTLVTRLIPFKCSIKPQSQNALNLLQHALDEARASC